MREGGAEISVVIRSRNEERWIGHTIQSILDHIPNSEILVVDNESTDDTMDVVRMFEYLAHIRTFSIVEYSPGSAINMAVARSTRKYTLCLSAHCVITKLDLQLLEEELKTHVCVFGKQIPIYRGKRITPRYIWSHFGDQPEKNMWSPIEERPFLHNAFAVYKRRTLIERPFDPKWYGKEDRYWARDRVKEGSIILYDPSHTCLHHWTPNGATWKGIG